MADTTVNLTGLWADFPQPVVDDPHPLYAAVRDQGPVVWVDLVDGRGTWLITRYEEARKVLTDPRFFKDMRRAGDLNPASVPPGLPQALFGYNMLSSDPPDHTRLRGLVAKVFTPTRVEALRPRVEEITEALLDAVDPAAGPVDLVGSFAFPLPIIVICELLGIPVGDREFLRDRFATVLIATLKPGDPEGEKAALEFAEYFYELFEDKRFTPADDLISALVATAARGQGGVPQDGRGETLSEQELLSTAFLLLLAGHETTVNLIGNGIVALLRHPDQLQALRDDPSLIPLAVEEILRYDGPVQHATNRFAAEDVEVGGVTIRQGDSVMVLLSGADRDAGQFADADAFDVRREDNRHLAFGHGIHFCLGAPLARLEGEVAFGALLRRFEKISLAVAPEELHWRYGMVLRSLLELPVHLTPC